MPDPRSAARRPATASLLAAATVLATAPASAIVYPDDVSDETSLALAQQGQFAGVGRVVVGGSSGTGVAIAPGWVLTATHFTPDGGAASFVLDGVPRRGTVIHGAGTDVALIRLDADAQLPASTVFIAPLGDGDALGQQVWKVGSGRFGTDSDAANGGPAGLSRSDGRQRAGTNVFDRRYDASADVAAFGPSLVMNRSRGAGATPYESTTAPGDSGGPAFLQRDNRWYLAGLTSGAIGGVGFVEAEVADAINFIESTTGQTFAPRAAPEELFWDPRYDVAGVQGGGGVWDQAEPNFTAGGFQYAWESDAAEPATAVFGTATTSASVVRVDGDITAPRLRFAETAAGSGPFQLVAGSGAIAVGDAGLAVESLAFARLNAEVAGAGSIRKSGAAELLFDGDNAGFSGELFVDEGTLLATRAEAFGVGGFNAGTRTTVADGATLRLRGTGLETDELLRLSGSGVGGAGALVVSLGDHTITQSVALLGDTTVGVETGQSLTLGGERGNFFRPGGVVAGVTKLGSGTLVLDRTNGASFLDVAEGVVAGVGGVTGAVSIAAGAELRPGDAADAAAVGAFRTNDLTLDAGGLLTLDLDAAAGLVDVVDVRGAASIAGELALNLLSAPTAGDTFVFLENDGTDAVSGLFGNGPVVSAVFGGTSYDFGLTYGAGSGNDVALTLIAIPEPGTAAALAAAGGVLLGRRRRGA